MGVLAALPGAAHAADSNGPSQIVVTGRGLADTPATPAYDVQDISREALTMATSGRIEDVLANVAGFQQFRRSDSRSSNPSAQGVTLRALGGNATSRALVLLDGVPMPIRCSAISPCRPSRPTGWVRFASRAAAAPARLAQARCPVPSSLPAPMPAPWACFPPRRWPTTAARRS